MAGLLACELVSKVSAVDADASEDLNSKLNRDLKPLIFNCNNSGE